MPCLEKGLSQNHKIILPQYIVNSNMKKYEIM